MAVRVAINGFGRIGRLVALGEDAGALHDQIDAERLPRQLGRIALGGHLDRAVADGDGVALGADLARKGAVHRVVFQQVGVGLGRAQIVDRDKLDVLALRFKRRA